ncbi:S100 calcium-binding protein A7-like 2 [Apodemus speciosus]|uniref:S100 calcium-binding protein A7-like 2 n=1 Tax=Apodemus speciosus TaxID=105296 RepID=A0ABQ0FW92_APOSI
MLEEDPATNILNQSKEKTSLEELWDMIMKIGLEYYEKMESNAF